MASSNVSSNCSYLTQGPDMAIFATKLVLLCLSFIANIAAITILLYFKSFRRFVFRLILCLLVASLVGVVVQIHQGEGRLGTNMCCFRLLGQCCSLDEQLCDHMDSGLSLLAHDPTKGQHQLLLFQCICSRGCCNLPLFPAAIYLQLDSFHHRPFWTIWALVLDQTD